MAESLLYALYSSYEIQAYNSVGNRNDWVSKYRDGLLRGKKKKNLSGSLSKLKFVGIRDHLIGACRGSSLELIWCYPLHN